MILRDWVRRGFRRTHLGLRLALLVFASLMPLVPAEAQKEDADPYKLKVEVFWFNSHPSGAFSGTGQNGMVDLNEDIGFDYYSTFFGKVDWKFTDKNHIYFVTLPPIKPKLLSPSEPHFLRGQTFNDGLVITGNFKANVYAVGYQYDFIRRKWGHIGVAAQVNFYDTSVSLDAIAQGSGEIPHAAMIATDSLLAPLPVAGPDIRFYFHPRFFITGNLLGMYFFGYGNYISTIDTVGAELIKNRLSARAGYSFALRLSINRSSDRMGIDLTQRAPVVGLELSF
jgi:hypothetical protein